MIHFIICCFGHLLLLSKTPFLMVSWVLCYEHEDRVCLVRKESSVCQTTHSFHRNFQEKVKENKVFDLSHSKGPQMRDPPKSRKIVV